jgi:hypothetical protein
MKTSRKVLVLLVTLAICAFAVSGPDLNKAVDSSPNRAKTAPPDLIFNRKLASTSISQSNDIVVVPGGLVAIDSPLNFNCPNGGCTITAEINLQVGENTTSNNLVGLCAELDGSIMPPGCPNIIIMPTNNLFVGGSFAFAQSGVTAGHHTLQSFLFSTFGLSRSYYNITYRLYTP